MPKSTAQASREVGSGTVPPVGPRRRRASDGAGAAAAGVALLGFAPIPGVCITGGGTTRSRRTASAGLAEAKMPATNNAQSIFLFICCLRCSSLPQSTQNLSSSHNLVSYSRTNLTSGDSCPNPLCCVIAFSFQSVFDYVCNLSIRLIRSAFRVTLG